MSDRKEYAPSGPWHRVCSLGRGALLALSMVLTVPGLLLAHNGGHDVQIPLNVRQWQDPDSRRPVRASLLRVDGRRVHLELPEGEVVRWPIDHLGARDRRYVEAYAQRVATLNGALRNPRASPSLSWWIFVLAVISGLVIMAPGLSTGLACLAVGGDGQPRYWRL